MNIQNLTQEQKEEILVTLNKYWQEQILNPKGIIEFDPATKLLDTYDHPSCLRMVLRTSHKSLRVMLVNKSLFDSILI